MKFSKTHQAFAKHLKDPKVFIKPEEYLGPNFKHVLDFWIYIDTLSDLEKKEIDDRYCVLDVWVRQSAWTAANKAIEEVVSEKFRAMAWFAASDYDIVGRLIVFGHATDELIGDVENKLAYDLIMSHKTC